MSKIIVQSTPITVLSLEEQDYISLTDMATDKEGDNLKGEEVGKEHFGDICFIVLDSASE